METLTEKTATELFMALVESFLERTGIGPTTLGRGAMGDPSFVRRLWEGRSPTLATVDHVLAFMEAYRRASQREDFAFSRFDVRLGQ